MKLQYWVCVLGPIESAKLPAAADHPIRTAVKSELKKMNLDAGSIWSGWGIGEEQVARIIAITLE